MGYTARPRRLGKLARSVTCALLLGLCTQSCLEGSNVEPPDGSVDGAADSTDGGVDAGPRPVGSNSEMDDGGAGTPVEPSDQRSDAGGSGTTAAMDAGADMDVDVRMDVFVDAGADMGVDAHMDMSMDAGVETDAGVGIFMDAGAGLVMDADMHTDVDAGLEMDAGLGSDMDADMHTDVDAGLEMDAGPGSDMDADMFTDAGGPQDAGMAGSERLVVSHGALSPAFDPDITEYLVHVRLLVSTISVTPSFPDAVSITVQGVPVADGSPSSPIPLNLGETAVSIVVQSPAEPPVTYAIRVRRGDLEAYVKASNAIGVSYFGCSVSLSGDTLAVGAWAEDGTATGVNGDQSGSSYTSSGAVYVFVRDGSTWAQQAYVKASNTNPGDNFGYAVALSGNTLAVGAYKEDSAGIGVNGDQTDRRAQDSGAAYVFVRSGATWAQQAYLKPSNTHASEGFGYALAISGETLAVGAYHEYSAARGVNAELDNRSAPYSGAVYVFTRSGNTWTQQAHVKASNADSGDEFGASVALSGDTLVVGANQEASAATGVDGDQSDNTANYSGAAYVFTRSGDVWSQQAYLKASNTDPIDNFGYSVAVSGDTLAVAALGEASSAAGVNGDQSDNMLFSNGAVYVYARSGATWHQQAYVKASNPWASGGFGASLALSGDVLAVGATGDRTAATGVGATHGPDTPTASGSGAVYMLARSGETWSHFAYVKASNTDAGDAFGIAVAMSGDTLAVGATHEASAARGVDGDQSSNASQSAGAAYVY